ncbi:hypothetical protein Pen01_64140 [Phytomonospora endophytica]|nr:hypothetical protein Pen01_64140 [Phytomonospora endophytica]
MVGVLVGVALLVMIPVTRGDPDDCGGNTMESGDTCVEFGGEGSWDYGENRDRIESSNKRNAWCCGIAGVLAIGLSIAGAVKTSQDAATAPRRQLAWPVPPGLGATVLSRKTVHGRLDVHDNGFTLTDDVGFIKSARWTDVRDVAVEFSRGLSDIEITVAGRDERITVNGTVTDLRDFTATVSRLAVERQYTELRGQLLAGTPVPVDGRAHLTMHVDGLTARDGRRLPWNRVTRVDLLNATTLRVHADGATWASCTVRGARGVALAAMMRTAAGV